MTTPTDAQALQDLGCTINKQNEKCSGDVYDLKKQIEQELLKTFSWEFVCKSQVFYRTVDMVIDHLAATNRLALPVTDADRAAALERVRTKGSFLPERLQAGHYNDCLILSNALSQPALSQPTAPQPIAAWKDKSKGEIPVSILTSSKFEHKEEEEAQPAPPADVSEDERVERFVTSLVGNLRDGSEGVMAAYELARLSKPRAKSDEHVPQDVLRQVYNALAYYGANQSIDCAIGNRANKALSALQPYLKGGD